METKLKPGSPSLTIPEIVFEDDHLLVVNKPKGLPSNHEPKRPETNSAEAWAKSIRGGDVYLVHRLDVDTSGLLLFCKSSVLFEELRERWKTTWVEKIYLARVLAPGPSGPFPMSIKTQIAHSEKSSKRMISLPEPIPAGYHYRGHPLVAHTEILESRISKNWNDLLTRQLTIRITTGVRHQIRVHLKSIGFPILGDALYGDVETRDLGSLQLHSSKLTLGALPGFWDTPREFRAAVTTL